MVGNGLQWQYLLSAGAFPGDASHLYGIYLRKKKHKTSSSNWWPQVWHSYVGQFNSLRNKKVNFLWLYHLESRWRNSHGLSWPLTNSPPKLGVALSKFWGKSLMNGYGNSEVWSQNIRVEGTKSVLEKHNNETSGNASSGEKKCVRSSSPLRCFTIKPQPQ